MEKAAIIPPIKQQEAASDLTQEQVDAITKLLFTNKGAVRGGVKKFANTLGYTMEDFKDC